MIEITDTEKIILTSFYPIRGYVRRGKEEFK